MVIEWPALMPIFCFFLFDWLAALFIRCCVLLWITKIIYPSISWILEFGIFGIGFAWL